MIFNMRGGSGGVKLPIMTSPASAGDILKDKQVIGQDGTIITGSIESVSMTAASLALDRTTGVVTATITPPDDGYISDQSELTSTLQVPVVEAVSPVVSISDTGLISATNTQSVGFIAGAAGSVATNTSTFQLQVRADTDITISDGGLINAPAGYYPQAATKQLTAVTDSDITISDAGLITAPAGYYSQAVTKQLTVRGNSDLTLNDTTGVVTAPAGYYPSNATITAGGAAPTITVSSTGLITATSGNKSSTQQLSTQAGRTITPSTSTQTAVSSGKYTTGAITVAGSANLKATNVRKGVKIFNVTGTLQAGIEIAVSVSTGVAYATVTYKKGSEEYTEECDSSGNCTVYLPSGGSWTFSAIDSTDEGVSREAKTVNAKTSFPITLAVGRSTTVSVSDSYTVTLEIIYPPKMKDYTDSRYGVAFAPMTVTQFGSGALKSIASFGGFDYPNEVVTNTYMNSGGMRSDAKGYLTEVFTDNSGQLDVSYEGKNGKAVGYNAAATVTANTGHLLPIFAGGWSDPDMYSDGGYSNTVFTYGTYSTNGGMSGSGYQSVDAVTLSVARAHLAGAGYEGQKVALFGGGKTGDTTVTNVVDAIQVAIGSSGITVTKLTAPTALSKARSHLSCICHSNNYIIFAGGIDASENPCNTVDAYNSSRSRSTPTVLSVARYSMAAALANNGTYALFAGGIGVNGVSKVIDAYNTSRTRTTPCQLSVGRHSLAAFSMQSKTVFAGGRPGIASGASAVVDVFDNSLSRVSIAMEYARYGCTGGSFINTNYYDETIEYGIIHGGFNESDQLPQYSTEWMEDILSTGS